MLDGATGLLERLARRHGTPRRVSPARVEGSAGPVSRLAKLGGGCPAVPTGRALRLELLDQATQSAFNVLIPNIRDAFHLSNAGSSIVALAGAAALAGDAPGGLAGRPHQPRAIALVGAGVGAAFSIALGFAPTAVVVATIMLVRHLPRAGRDLPHPQLAAWPTTTPSRPGPGSTRSTGPGSQLGAIVGVLIGAGLTAAFSWRAPFIVFAVPIVFVVVLSGCACASRPGAGSRQLA
jgi:MFS family permease